MMQKIFYVFMTAIVSCAGHSTAEKTIASSLPFSAAAFGKGHDTNDRITGIGVGYSHMTLYSMKSFELREINGETVFSCRFFENEEEIKIEKMRVSAEYMHRLREIAKKYDFAGLKERKTPNRPFIRDAPMYQMTLYWPDKKSLRLNYRPANGSEELEKFFRELAKIKPIK